MTTKGPQVIVSRAHPEILRKLFTFEIPEVANDVVKIRAIAREAGYRSKVAVSTEDENIDPIGSCIGQRGTRIQTIINELAGEKIDIIEWSDDMKKMITNALSPAKISSIETNNEEKTAVVQVKADQLSLAIGRGGQNVRLAAKLTGWKINIQGEDGEATPEVTAEKAEPATEEKKDDDSSAGEESAEDKKEEGGKE